MTPLSPLFAAPQLTLSPTRSLDGEQLLVPQLPDKPAAHTSSIEVYIIPAEKAVFVQGFEPHEYAERPPSLLRGCLYLRVLKPSRIKSISLQFKGQMRTDWPEGIVPKKNQYVEFNDIVSHTWPFYQLENPVANGGADIFQPAKRPHSDTDVSHLSLTSIGSRSNSPAPDTISLSHGSGGFGAGNFFTRNLSPAANFVRKATTSSLGDSLTDLTAVSTNPDTDAAKAGHFPTGDYIYNFEHAIHPSVPELTEVTFGLVAYHLEADITRVGAFKSNLTARVPVEIIRTPAESNTEENEPIVITRDWEDQLRYDVVVGGKSVVLDLYLPLAFRFVPLYGKVALHRIRVYLTENLEYYCNDKKVHRSEPSKRILLLEHKALKGKSLLSVSGGMVEEEDDDDEILPRELEFQLFVPKIINKKFHHKIHPDTSFENIQLHHWIKIGLRISKPDPDIPDKRKHYEISIDLPIRILLAEAAHGNTLLPAYDDAPIFATSPPMSPDVTPVDGHGLFLLLASGHTNLDATLTPSRPQSPFHHINSPLNNDDPTERDADMHLGANLFQPEETPDEVLLHSPQAVPHPGTFSPVNSPMMRPIHMLRRPSYNPPPFEADVAPPEIDAPPPAYQEDDPAMSPLRIDDLSSSISGLSLPQNSRHNSSIDARSSVSTRTTNDSDPREIPIAAPAPVRTPVPVDLLPSIEAELAKASLSSENSLKQPPEEEDLADVSSPIHGPTLHVPVASRHSSVSSAASATLATSDDLPIDQTMPLLGSTTSLGTFTNAPAPKSRNGSVHSLLQDANRRPSNMVGFSTSIFDMVSGDLANDTSRVHNNLANLRNPRIKKHYQADEVGEPPQEVDSDTEVPGLKMGYNIAA